MWDVCFTDASKASMESGSFVVDRDYCFYTCSYDASWSSQALSVTEHACTWYFDSGASKHITSRRDLFCNVSPVSLLASQFNVLTMLHIQFVALGRFSSQPLMALFSALQMPYMYQG